MHAVSACITCQTSVSIENQQRQQAPHPRCYPANTKRPNVTGVFCRCSTMATTRQPRCEDILCLAGKHSAPGPGESLVFTPALTLARRRVKLSTPRATRGQPTPDTARYLQKDITSPRSFTAGSDRRLFFDKQRRGCAGRPPRSDSD